MLSLIRERLEDARVDQIVPLFSSLGALLAELHAARIGDGHHLPRFDINPPEKKTFIEENVYRRSVQQILGIGGEAGHAPVLVHGDYGYHNVICDLSGQHRVIDWENGRHGRSENGSGQCVVLDPFALSGPCRPVR